MAPLALEGPRRGFGRPDLVEEGERPRVPLKDNPQEIAQRGLDLLLGRGGQAQPRRW